MTISLGQTVLYNVITPVRVLLTTNLVGNYLNGPSNNGVGATLTIDDTSLTIDDVNLYVGNRILLSNQTEALQNGIYIIKSIDLKVILQRSDDQQNIEQLKAGQFIVVGAGTSNKGKIYSLVEPLPQFIGFDPFIYMPSSVGTGGGLSDVLASANIFVGNQSNIATGVPMAGDIAISSDGKTNIVDSSIFNRMISNTAAIDYAKLASLSSGNILVGNGSNVATSVAMSGDIAISNAGNTTIGSNVIDNTMISTTADIDYAKLASLSSGNILVGNGSNVATSVAMSGDIAISNAGNTTIGSNVIDNTMISNTAAIDYAKLAPLATGSILTGNAGVPTATALSGDATIAETGVLTIANNAITTIKILDANVTLSKLSAGISPSHVIKFAGQVTTVGGSATETFSIPGIVAATDLDFVQLVDGGADLVTILSASIIDDGIVIIFSADPGDNAVLNYQILRAAV